MDNCEPTTVTLYALYTLCGTTIFLALLAFGAFDEWTAHQQSMLNASLLAGQCSKN